MQKGIGLTNGKIDYTVEWVFDLEIFGFESTGAERGNENVKSIIRIGSQIT